MRRQPETTELLPGAGRFEVTIKSPTLGLVTRIPADQPDPRYAAAASNVRFDDGVVRNAPGIAAVTNAAPDSEVNLIFQATVTSGMNTQNAVLIGTSQKLFALVDVNEAMFPLVENQVIEFMGAIQNYDGIRNIITSEMTTPKVILVSLNDDGEYWKLRARAIGEDDNSASYLLPIDYGANTNNKIWVRIG